MDKLIQEMANHTDCWPWYWMSVGEKCYAFQTVEAFPAKQGDPPPPPGSELVYDYECDGPCGNNGTEMVVESVIAEIESQNGDTICAFIAGAHAKLMSDYLAKD